MALDRSPESKLKFREGADGGVSKQNANLVTDNHKVNIFCFEKVY